METFLSTLRNFPLQVRHKLTAVAVGESFDEKYPISSFLPALTDTE